MFDSGVGGLSVLRALREQLPWVDLVYVADSAHAPYGERDDAFIIQRSLDISRFLLEQDVTGIVVACNTATAVAIHELRRTWPDLPIVGVEPGIKPAIALSSNKRVGVLATRSTLSSDKFKMLVARHGSDAALFLQPCPGLAKAIEHGDLSRPELLELIDLYCRPLSEAGVDTVVLGCTHYPFVKRQLQSALGPDVALLDTAVAVANRAASLLAQGPISDAQLGLVGATQAWTTGEPAHLAHVADAWLGWSLPARELPTSVPSTSV